MSPTKGQPTRDESWALPTVAYPERAHGPTAIVDVTVVPMDRDAILPGHSVVVEAGRITRLGPSSQIDVTGMRVVDGKGRFLLPGLADMHAHLGMPLDLLFAQDPGEMLMYLARGVTLVRNMWGQPFHLAMRQAVDAGDLPGPRLVTAGPLIDGPHPSGNGRPFVYRSVILTDPADAASVVQKHSRRGYDLIKAYGWLPLDALRALGRAAAAAGLPMAGHCPEHITFEQAADAGMICFEHLHNIYNGRLRGGGSVVDPYDANPETVERIDTRFDWDGLRRLADRMANEQIWNCPTAVLRLGRPVVSELGERPVAGFADDLAGLSPITATVLRDHPLINRPLSAAPQAIIDARRKRDDLNLRIIKTLHDHGAPLLVGTDAHNLPGRSVHEELGAFVQAGLTPYQALRCATSEPARYLGRQSDVGTVAVGKRADLILLNANPLVDIAATRDLAAVFVNGHYLDMPGIRELLAARSADMAAPLPAPPLSPAPRGTGRVRRGSLIERRLGTVTGVLAYAHHRDTGGGWVIDETSRSHTSEKAAHIVLSPALTLRRADVTTTTIIGKATVTLELLDGRGYRVTIVDADGEETTDYLGDHPLAASDTLALTGVLVHLADRDQDAHLAAIGADCEGVEPHTLIVRAPDARWPGPWRVSIDHPREPPGAYDITLSRDGEIRSINRRYVSEVVTDEVVWERSG